MGKISIKPGGWTAGISFVFAGAAEVIGATIEQDWLRYIGWAAMVLGLLVLFWSIRIDGASLWVRLKYWWRNRSEHKKFTASQSDVTSVGKLFEAQRKLTNADAQLHGLTNSRMSLKLAERGIKQTIDHFERGHRDVKFYSDRWSSIRMQIIDVFDHPIVLEEASQIGLTTDKCDMRLQFLGMGKPNQIEFDALLELCAVICKSIDSAESRIKSEQFSAKRAFEDVVNNG